MNLRTTLAAILAIGTACGPSQEELDAANARIAELQGELGTANERNGELEQRIGEVESQNGELANRLRALGQTVEGLEGQRSELQGELNETQRALEELRERERQAQARLETFRNLLNRFRSMIESGRLRVRIVRNRMVVELPEGILFDSGRAELKESGQATLSEVGQVLQQVGEREFQIAGHTDNVPLGRRARFGDNWELSAARAVNVARYLTEQGVPANRISAAGYADTQPVSSNETPEGRAQNRRIEIVLVPSLDELPDLSSLSE
ncbi:MAG: OmpA family protein [Sandaracinus sp.]|nr:OmpA family protein [Sandaracinus sp.]MCB9623853.1 OmpA family protein [Sandaracinus sp.]MCB9634179.1 OmpA family protein [Sandaracinus sp.]